MIFVNVLRRSVRIASKVYGTAVTCVALLVVFGTSAQGQVLHEAPPVLSATQLLPPDMLAGPLFQVDDRVPTDGYLGHFTLRSELGTFTVPSRDLLRIRIAELPAIQQLDETSKSETFMSGAASAAARPVEAAVNIVANPVGTAQSLPGGIARFFDRVEMGGKAIAQAATDSTKSGDKKAQETAQRVGDVTITALGSNRSGASWRNSSGLTRTRPIPCLPRSSRTWPGWPSRPVWG
jgi:hypothetical protein